MHIDIVGLLLFFYILRIDGPNELLINIAGLVLFVWGMVGAIKIQTDRDLSPVIKSVYTIFWAGVAYGSNMTGANPTASFIYLVLLALILCFCAYAELHEERMAVFLKQIYYPKI